MSAWSAACLEGLSYQIFDPQGNDLGTGRAEVNALGGFDFNFTLPENANLGYARIEMDAGVGMDGRYHSHSFQIQEFRRPEFEVTARNETTGPYFVGESATVAVEAKYFAGGPLPNAEVNWLVSSTPTNYSPPNWPDFTFGIWEPWWWFYHDFDRRRNGIPELQRLTDATGNHYLKMDFEPNDSLRPHQRAGRSHRHGRQPPGLGWLDQPAGASGRPVRGHAQRALFRRARPALGDRV